MVILSIAFLLRSVNAAEALPTPNKFLTEGTNKIGKYMIQMYTNSRDTDRRYAIVWDTETGRSIGYY